MSEKTKHTLFSFVTTRPPQLLTDEQKELLYIRYEPTSNYFDGLSVASGTREAYLLNLKTLLGNFSSPLSGRSQLKDLVGEDFYNFTNAFVNKKIGDYAIPVTGGPAPQSEPEGRMHGMQGSGSKPMPDPLQEGVVISLWNNLFYQLLTNNYSLQEHLQQAIAANNFLQKVYMGESPDILIDAKVSLPQWLYGPLPAAGSVAGSPFVNTAPLQQSIEKLKAKEEIKQYGDILSTLNKAKESHSKLNDAKYLADRAAFDQNADILWSEDRHDNPGLHEDEGMKPVAGITPFNFQPLDSPFTTANVYSLFTPDAEFYARSLNLAAATGFDEAIAQINNAVHQQTAVLFNDTALTSDITVVAGQILPAGSQLPDTATYSYLITLIPTGTNTYKAAMAINMGNANTIVSSVSYDISSGTETAFTQQRFGNTVVLTLFPGGNFVPPADDFSFSGTVTLQNGSKLSFKTFVNVATGASGMLAVYGPVTQQDPTNAPSGFGVKRAGIADYRKVEQEVCCYDQGEVSHIENIMAREYKERSTRRLRRSEDTTTTESSSESENLTDSTSTDRFEMQQQTAKAISESTSESINASVGFNKWGISASLSGSHASNTSQQQSNSQAVQLSKDITQKASEKITTKIREERITKIIDEFEEQNKHGYDNREGDTHVSGVYRWIDKVYKNQIFNYGKRLMYEFMIPQPAVFHNAAMKTASTGPVGTTLQKPVDPRVGDGVVRIKDHTEITEANSKYWAAIYDAEIEAPKEETIILGKCFDHYSQEPNRGEGKTGVIAIPDGYVTKKAHILFTGMAAGISDWDRKIIATVGNKAQISFPVRIDDMYQYFFDIKEFTKEIPVAVSFCNFHLGAVNISVQCSITNEAAVQWKINTFNAIIKAYENKLAAYNDAMASAVSDTVKGTNPGFYRTIENTVLRKCCISYLMPQNKEMGTDQHYTPGDLTVTKPHNDAAMEEYAGLVKFMEQAFEWEILSYTFYPFYWSYKADWQAAYRQDNDDAIFRAFLQSGMARAIVSVRPGFEEAVMYYMATGKVWNGGQVPVIGDDLYLSIVEELKHPEYYVEETWETRVPTTLTLIQEGGISAEADGLPCECGDENNIKQSNAKLAAML